MSTKSDITALINTNLASASNITAAEHRAVLTDGILENYYPSIIKETQATTNIVTSRNIVNLSLLYTVDIVKIGRVVFMKGFVRNTSSNIFSNNNLDDFFFEITNSEYFPSPVASILSDFFPTSNGSYIQMGSTGNKKIYISLIGANQSVFFNFHYNTIN